MGGITLNPYAFLNNFGPPGGTPGVEIDILQSETFLGSSIISSSPHNFGLLAVINGNSRVACFFTNSETDGSHATALTWGGVSAVASTSEGSTGGNKSQLWYILEDDFPVDDEGDIIVTYADVGTGSLFTQGIVNVVILKDAELQGPEANAVNGVTASPVSADITTLTDDAIILSDVSVGNSGTSSVTEGPDQIKIEQSSHPSDRASSAALSYRKTTTPGLYTTGFSHSTTPNRMALTTVAFTQLGNGGDPALDILANAVGWWEPRDASNIHDGSNFSQLTDLSGNGNHLVQATGAQQPARLDSGGLISAVLTGGSAMNMRTAAATAALMNNFNSGGTMLAVVNPTSSTSFRRVWAKTPNDFEYLVLETTTTNPTWNWSFEFDTSHGRRRQNKDFIPVGQETLIEARVDKLDNSISDLVAGVDGVPLTLADGLSNFGSEDGEETDLTGENFILGNNNGNSNAFDGGVLALVFLNTFLSDPDMNIVRSYLASEFEVTL